MKTVALEVKTLEMDTLVEWRGKEETDSGGGGWRTVD